MSYEKCDSSFTPQKRYFPLIKLKFGEHEKKERRNKKEKNDETTGYDPHFMQ